jgi:hypothetical protein
MLFLHSKFGQKLGPMRHLMKVSLIFGLLFFLSSCKKETKGPYTITIRVVNSNGIPIQNCGIRMFAPVGAQGTVNYYGVTDLYGEEVFNYEYPAYLRIDALKSTWKGCGFVELDSRNSVESVIVIKPFGDPDNGCPPA